MKSSVVEPQAIESTPQLATLRKCKESSVFIADVPVLGRIYILPLSCHAPYMDNLLQQLQRPGCRPWDVRRLTVIMGDELNGVRKRAVLMVDNLGQEVEFAELVKMPYAFAGR